MELFDTDAHAIYATHQLHSTTPTRLAHIMAALTSELTRQAHGIYANPFAAGFTFFAAACCFRALLY